MALTPKAIETLGEIMQDPKVSPGVRVTAAATSPASGRGGRPRRRGAVLCRDERCGRETPRAAATALTGRPPAGLWLHDLRMAVRLVVRTLSCFGRAGAQT